MTDNNRQIPKSKKICSNSNYLDLLYNQLQFISKPFINSDKIVEYRYILKNDVKYTELGKIFNMTRQTVAKKFKNLIEMGLVKEENDRYILSVLTKEDALLIPTETSEVLSAVLNQRAISIYAYLFNRMYANSFEPFITRLSLLKEHVGISSSARNNNDIIVNILFFLQEAGLIDYEMTTVLSDTQTNFNNVKTIYQINNVYAYVHDDDSADKKAKIKVNIKNIELKKRVKKANI